MTISHHNQDSSKTTTEATFYRESCYGLHHHQQQHQTPVAQTQNLIYPVPYEQPTPLHKSDWDLDALPRSPPVLHKVINNKSKSIPPRYKISAIQIRNKMTSINWERPWECSSIMNFLGHQALPQRYILRKLQQLHVKHHSLTQQQIIFNIQRSYVNMPQISILQSEETRGKLHTRK